MRVSRGILNLVKLGDEIPGIKGEPGIRVAVFRVTLKQRLQNLLYGELGIPDT